MIQRGDWVGGLRGQADGVGGLLLDSGDLRAKHGRVMIGITLVEDLAVVVLTVLLPALGHVGTSRSATIGKALWLAVLLVPFSYLRPKRSPVIDAYKTQNAELFLLVSLSLGIGRRRDTDGGIVPCLGAFLAGLIVPRVGVRARNACQAALTSRCIRRPFVTIRILIDPRIVVQSSAARPHARLILIGKFVIWTLVVRLSVTPGAPHPRRRRSHADRRVFFVLVQVAKTAGHVGEDVYNATLAASLLSILLNAPFVRYAPRWIAALHLRMGRAAMPMQGRQDEQAGHVVVCGFGRMGSTVGLALTILGSPTVIERDPDLVRQLRRRGISCVYGDASQNRVVDCSRR